MVKAQRRFRMSIADVLIYLFMIIVVLVCFIPFVYMLALSLSSPEAIINNKVSLIPVGVNFEAYIQIFTYPNFFRAYGNTIFYTVAGTCIALFMTTLFAYAMSKRFLKGHKVVMMLIVFSMFFSGGLIPTYLLISNLQLTGTVWAMLLPFAINQFNLIILINFIRAIPSEIEEAAIIDGLNYFGILYRVILPLSTPALATIGLYTAVFFWNDWFNGLIYLNTNQYPVMLFLRNIVNGTTMIGDGAGAADRSTIAMSIKSAVIITSTLPIIILYPLLQRFFVAGLTVGSVKG
ncbi:carbohydrate ABC transporter permease [Paenibacillus senegalensis]|uniref:carbohydrate ABC transporter permease n=1 Tax=Paenibacillus senegalensis TaxID=1465766 RepID=UPI000289C1D8|nr:carbohydrate ABC transporter permease [Paenibacillus senegalensis]